MHEGIGHARRDRGLKRRITSLRQDHHTEVAESTHMAAHLTRKEMKRDEVMESLGSVIGYVREHPRLILVVIGLSFFAFFSGKFDVYFVALGVEFTE